MVELRLTHRSRFSRASGRRFGDPPHPLLGLTAETLVDELDSTSREAPGCPPEPSPARSTGGDIVEARQSLLGRLGASAARTSRFGREKTSLAAALSCSLNRGCRGAGRLGFSFWFLLRGSIAVGLGQGQTERPTRVVRRTALKGPPPPAVPIPTTPRRSPVVVA